jgi:hypothetical protein
VSGLAVEASVEKREVKPERIVYLRKTIRMTLDGEIPGSTSRAKNQAEGTKTLLNYAMSPELRQQVVTGSLSCARSSPRTFDVIMKRLAAASD